MTKERELLRRALDYLSGLPARSYIQDDIEAYLSTSDDAEEPVYQIAMAEGSTRTAWIDVAKNVFDDAGMYGEYKRRALFLHPPKPAEPAASELYKALEDLVCLCEVGLKSGYDVDAELADARAALAALKEER